MVPLHRSPLLPLQLMQGNCPEHHDCQRVERSYRARDGCTGLDGRGALLHGGSPTLHKYTSTSLVQRSSLVAGYTYGLRDAQHRIHGSVTEHAYGFEVRWPTSVEHQLSATAIECRRFAQNMPNVTTSKVRTKGGPNPWMPENVTCSPTVDIPTG